MFHFAWHPLHFILKNLSDHRNQYSTTICKSVVFKASLVLWDEVEDMIHYGVQ
jgi:hypothetical protein